MRLKVSISVLLLFLFSPLTGSDKDIFGASYFWPLKLEKKFSSGFGDNRPGRFHMGVDLRTGGKPGAMVFAPEDGYVWRIKTGYRGYGKALYIKGKSGKLYVFGHLQNYNWDIGSHLRQHQLDSLRYYQDIYPRPNEFPVKRGDFIARTGQTGAGAPHLHFEVRDDQNQPTNPFYYQGIGIKDKQKPQFQVIWLRYLDDHSLFEDGHRERLIIPIFDQQTGKFVVRDTITVTGRFAILAAIEDIVTRGSFTLGPSRVTLHIDGHIYHEVEYDRISFDENIFSIIDKNEEPDKKHFKRVYNLYRKSGSRLSNYWSEIPGDGSFSDTTAGYHTVRITAYDPSGNKTDLDFGFYYIPNNRILAPLNRARISDSTIALLLEPDRAPFDSVAIFTSDEDSSWVQIYPEIMVNDYSLNLDGDFDGWNDYQIRFFHGQTAYPASYFSAFAVSPTGQAIIDAAEYRIIDGGLHFFADPLTGGVNWLMAEIVTDRGPVRQFCRKTSDGRFTYYYSPEVDIETIDKIIFRGPVGFRPDTVSFNIHRIIADTPVEIDIRGGVSLAFDSGVLFDDAILEIRDTIMPPLETGYYLYGPYAIGSEAYSFADWADFKSEIDDPGVASRTGLYVFDDEDGWLWASGEYDLGSGTLHSDLGGAGVIAVIVDTAGPVITDLNIRENHPVQLSRPPIRFKMIDELSGIENDLNFNVTIDDKWIVPEYDPEQKLFVSKPHWQLRVGVHHLRIEVEDRCGNSTSISREFRIRAKTGP